MPRPHEPPRIRARTAADLERCARVLARVHEADGYPHHWPPDPARWLVPRGLLGAWVAVAEAPEAIAGHVVLCAATAEASAAVWSGATGLAPERLAAVTRLFVAPESRGLGLGRRLFETACAEAAGRGLRPALDVVETNRSAIALYERLGWQRVASELWAFARELRLHYYIAPPGAEAPLD